MGACWAQRERIPLTFGKQEKIIISQVFHTYCDLFQDTRKLKELSQESFVEIFSDNPQFGLKFYQFLLKYGHLEKYITLDVLLETLEILLKENYTTNNMKFKSLKTFELVMLIVLENTSFIINGQELDLLKITQLQALEIIIHIMKMFNFNTKNKQINEKTAKAFINSLFNTTIVSWKYLTDYINDQLFEINSIIRIYFEHKFCAKQNNFILAQLNQSSYILNSEWISMFYLSLRSSVFNTANQISLLYSNLLDENNFELIYSRILENKHPIMLICLTEDKYGNILKQFAFGALTNVPLRDLGEKQGGSEDCLFQILPNYKVYFTKPKSQIQSKFVYFSRQGLGFGSADNGKYRIWIDGQDMLRKSYCLEDDDIYEKGHLLAPQLKNKQLKVIEVWSVQYPKKKQKKNKSMEGGEIEFNYLQNQQQILYQLIFIHRVQLDEDISQLADSSMFMIDSEAPFNNQIDEKVWDKLSGDGFEDVKIGDQFEEVRVSGKTDNSEQEQHLKESDNAGFGQESGSFGSGFEEEKIFTKDTSQQDSGNNSNKEYLLKSEAFGIESQSSSGFANSSAFGSSSRAVGKSQGFGSESFNDDMSQKQNINKLKNTYMQDVDIIEEDLKESMRSQV